MNGPIAQIVALTCHANAFIKNGNSRVFFPDNSTCKFCDYVKFVESKKTWPGKSKEREVSGNPNEWFEYLKNKSACGLMVFLSPQNNPGISDRRSAGFVAGGGTWGIEVAYPSNVSEFWITKWEVWNKNAPEQRIWRVTYGLASKEKTSHSNDNLEEKRENLIKALKEVVGFSEKQNCGEFRNCFMKSLETLESGKKQGYHQDLSPKGVLSGEGEVILDACQSAWVFGGMGSWNDMGFDGDAQKEYERISDKLFNGVTGSIVAATNTSFRNTVNTF